MGFFLDEVYRLITHILNEQKTGFILTIHVKVI